MSHKPSDTANRFQEKSRCADSRNAFPVATCAEFSLVLFVICIHTSSSKNTTFSREEFGIFVRMRQQLRLLLSEHSSYSELNIHSKMEYLRAIRLMGEGVECKFKGERWKDSRYQVTNIERTALSPASYNLSFLLPFLLRNRNKFAYTKPAPSFYCFIPPLKFNTAVCPISFRVYHRLCTDFRN